MWKLHLLLELAIKDDTPADIRYYGEKNEKVYLCTIRDARNILISENYLKKNVANFVQHIHKNNMLKFFNELIESNKEERDEIIKYALNNRNNKKQKREETLMLSLSNLF